MKLQGARILLTGVSGGIGRALAEKLGEKGARLGLVARRAESLEKVAESVRSAGGEAVPVVADICESGGRAAAVSAMAEAYGGSDVLINNAGTTAFTDYSQQDEEEIESILRTNLLAPMLLTRSMLPVMKAAGHGKIVNIGSTFGSIGFAWFVGYSTSKFGLRGFSEALRRELEGTGISVMYIAPRSVKTPLNTDAVYNMAKHVKMNIDEPEWVADKIVAALVDDRKDAYPGFPESLFVRINALLPRLVDRALHKQNHESRKFISK